MSSTNSSSSSQLILVGCTVAFAALAVALGSASTGRRSRSTGTTGESSRCSGSTEGDGSIQSNVSFDHAVAGGGSNPPTTLGTPDNVGSGITNGAHQDREGKLVAVERIWDRIRVAKAARNDFETVYNDLLTQLKGVLQGKVNSNLHPHTSQIAMGHEATEIHTATAGTIIISANAVAANGNGALVDEEEDPIAIVLGDGFDGIMESIFTHLPIKEQARNKLVCKRWETLNTKSIEKSPKKAFETNKELRLAVLIYCDTGGRYSEKNLREGWITIPPPTRSQQEMVSHVYGLVINNWNVSLIEDFHEVFFDCYYFDEDISSWNTSNANGMSFMFHQASSFNQPLNGWNTSKVDDMSYMFYGASSFNQPLNEWNTSNVEDMAWMFAEASSFNQPLNAWNTSNVEIMRFMFHGASSFNCPIGMWDTSNVENMSHMFFGALSFDRPLNEWNTSNVKYMIRMFEGAWSFNQPLNQWNTSNVTTMAGMFDGAVAFDHPIDMWDTSAITDPNNMP